MNPDLQLDALLTEINDESVNAPNEQLTPEAGNERRAVLRYLVGWVRGYNPGAPQREAVLHLVDDLRHGDHTERSRR
jgi:hypothetical protein